MTQDRSNPMADWPSDADLSLARHLLDRLAERGNDPQLDADGKIHLGPMTRRESDWAKSNRAAVRAGLVGAVRYTVGSLDAIYEISEPTNPIGSGTEPRKGVKR